MVLRRQVFSHTIQVPSLSLKLGKVTKRIKVMKATKVMEATMVVVVVARMIPEREVKLEQKMVEDRMELVEVVWMVEPDVVMHQVIVVETVLAMEVAKNLGTMKEI